MSYLNCQSPWRVCGCAPVCAAALLTAWMVAACPAASAAREKTAGKARVRYQVIDIAPLPRVADEVAPAINDSGEVSLWQQTADGTIHAFLWRAGFLQDLGALEGDASSISRALNKHGQIVGWSVDGKNLVDSLVTTRAFLFSEGHLADLGTLGGRHIQAMHINGRGQIVGVADLSSQDKHAFLYEKGKLKDLGTLPGGTYSAASAINDNGVVAGTAETSAHLIHAALWTGRRLVDLGTLPGGMRSRALALDGEGDVVGFSEVEHGEIHAFFYSNGRMRDLGSLGKDPIRANAVNDRGQVVGLSGVSEHVRHAFVWQNAKMEDLNDLIPAEPTWRLNEAFALNDRGEIICAGARLGSFGELRLLLLKPIPRQP
jgi:probable HAF family extracellular repeat protein